jgi:hypothetical protein
VLVEEIPVDMLIFPLALLQNPRCEGFGRVASMRRWAEAQSLVEYIRWARTEEKGTRV